MPPPAEGLASRFVLGPALRTQPDRRLVTLVREGYEVAFEEIVRRYGKPLGRYAASIVGGRSEDVLQDSFSKALPALRRSDAEIDLRPWLFRIVRNTALNELRDSPPSAEALAEAISGGRNPAEELERREELADLMKRLRALPEPQRAAIVMRELEGLGHEEIASALGLSGGAARQTIYRARRALRDGAGMLVPLPLLKVMLAGAAPGAAEVAVASAAAGAGGAGAGVALKATAATVLVAGAVGAGVAVDQGRHGRDAEAAPARVSQGGSGSGRAAPLTAAAVPSASDDRDRHEGRGGDDRGRDGRGHGPGDDHGGHGGERVEDHSGSGRSGNGGDGSSGHEGSGDSSGPSHSGHGGGEPDQDSGTEGSLPSSSGSGSGSSGSGSSGSGSGEGSGSGSGEIDSDGGGDGSSGSGSGGLEASETESSDDSGQ